jgi:hypothetical protein
MLTECEKYNSRAGAAIHAPSAQPTETSFTHVSRIARVIRLCHRSAMQITSSRVGRRYELHQAASSRNPSLRMDIPVTKGGIGPK